MGVEQNNPISTPGVAKAAAFDATEVAACDQLAAGRGRRALHGGDHRFGQLHDRLHHRAARIHDLREIGAAAIGIGAAGGELLHVMARGKRGAAGRDHHRAHAGIVAKLVHRAVQFGDQGLRQAVARRGPVQRQHRDGPCVVTE